MARHINLLGEDLIEFEGFKVCDKNIQAYCACTLIAKGDDPDFDPFIIYGDEGTGKTHLLSETAETLQKTHKVFCTNGDDFSSSLAEAIASGALQSFRNEYLSADYVLIDDIDQINGIDAEAELLKILAFHMGVLLTANKKPSRLPFENERLIAKIKDCIEIEIKRSEEV